MSVKVKEFKVRIDKVESGRQQALDFINNDLKPEQVLSICECFIPVGFVKNFRVAVWYKE